MGNHHGHGSSMFTSVNDHHDLMNPKNKQQYEIEVSNIDDDEMNQELTRVVKEQEQVDENEIKNGLPFGVILLGSTDSGKSTLWNRWKIQTQSLSQSEKLEFTNLILTYIITSLKRLVDKAKSTISQDEYDNLYSKHDFTIDLLSQISESGSLFEHLFVNPISKTKMQSLWIDHDFIAHLPALFQERSIQKLYNQECSENQEDMEHELNRNYSNHYFVNAQNQEEGVVNEILLGNYLHYFLKNPSFLQELSETFTHSAANTILREYSTSPSSSSNSGMVFSKPINLTMIDILKAKIVTTSINTLKFQFSKRSISTKVIKVIEKRKRGLSGASLNAAALSSNASPSSPTVDSIQVHGKSGNIAIPKLVLNQNTLPKEEKSLLPKSARGNNSMTPRSNSVTSRPSNINDDSVQAQNSPPKKSTTKKLVESLVRKRSSSNTATNSTTGNSAKTPFLTISPGNSPRTSITSEGSSFSPLLGTSPSSSMGMPSQNFNSKETVGSNQATLNTSSVVKAMQENAFSLDLFEKKKLQKFTILDTPGIVSQRDLVLMTLNASTRPTANFSLKSVVFMVSLADFDLTLIDGKDEKIKRLHDSLSFFEKTLIMSNNLKETRRILLFTHVDIFESRILELTETTKKQLLELLGYNHVNNESNCLENCELVQLTFKHIVSRFDILERKNSHKYILEYYALNLMESRDVCEFTYHLTMREGYLKKDYPSKMSINVYSSPIVSGCEYEVNQNLQMVNSFFDLSIKCQ